jgi:hypothetical protein
MKEIEEAEAQSVRGVEPQPKHEEVLAHETSEVLAHA